ncbi:hypothetical protein Desca_0908 [Desulfotomaculum nigrificans CO-1-SRB]|uniref:Uncharacterized protein n=1 Tax=Desulfotomaculum nigrificans (strain DSM 14880 / VKM B-2319 / CO-1-SRB) TaxID=868595 RepID=F6B9T9_DESCC|nr:hypothetical protein [Desulfotomaculum nigrificans]AEF93787.1 hypothetical protein Desca_0908 [Desulfotomaculum nigrificans CO-1-SRB]
MMRKFTLERLWENKNYFLDRINSLKKTPAQKPIMETTIKRGLRQFDK